MNRVQIYVPGILVVPGASRNWDGRAVTHTHTWSDYRAEKVEYWCGPVSRAFGQKERAEKLYRTISYYDGKDWQRVLVGHSNGSDVILTMLRERQWMPRIDALHLVCAATCSDFERNGLNSLLIRGKVGQVFIYVAGKDLVLRLASLRLARMLGYGTLGLHGPKNVSKYAAERVTTINDGVWKSFGHSDCWNDVHFNGTMSLFLRP
jgi:pimeloyl-ACP methyl ester carboxylesterase